MRPAPLERSRQHIGHRLHELDLDRLESPQRAAVCDQRSIGAFGGRNHDAETADHSHLAHSERVLQVFVGPQILDRHGRGRLQRWWADAPVKLQRPSALAVRAGADAHANTVLRPIVSGDEAECLAVRLELEHVHEVDLQYLGDMRHGALDHAGLLGLAQGEQAELGERLQPAQRRIQLRSGAALLRDVASDDDDAGNVAALVADRAALGLHHVHRAVARQKPVLDAISDAGAHGFAEDLADALAVPGDDVPERVAAHEVLRVAQQRGVGRAVVDAPPLGVEKGDQVARVADDQRDEGGGRMNVRRIAFPAGRGLLAIAARGRLGHFVFRGHTVSAAPRCGASFWRRLRRPRPWPRRVARLGPCDESTPFAGGAEPEALDQPRSNALVYSGLAAYFDCATM